MSRHSLLLAAAVVVAVLILACLRPVQSGDQDVTRKTGVLHQSVTLDCDTSPSSSSVASSQSISTSPSSAAAAGSQPSDTLLIILWHRNDSLLYSYDMRNAAADTERSWINATAIARDRIDLDLRSQPARLQLRRLQRQDGGLYRCRVDFQRSRTKYSSTLVSVVVPPVLQVTANGLPVSGSVAGPFRIGDSLQLACRAVQGEPRPLLWWEPSGAGVAVDGSAATSDQPRTVTLNVAYLSRAHLGRQLTCWSKNTNLTRPVHKSITLDMHLSPLAVSIVDKRDRLLADHSTTVRCQCLGSRPPADITWFLGPAPLAPPASVNTVSAEGNVTLSEILFTPRAADHNRPLYCRCDNRHLEAPTLEDIWRLHVHYAPLVTVKMAASLRPDSIKEGDDVYFECDTDANPPVQTISWLHNGEQLVQNVAAGVIVTNDSLVLQRVAVPSAGRYTCVATNAIGSAASRQPALLDVKYPPKCRPGLKEVYGAAKREEVHVLCQVDANPDTVEFEWSFNNNVESLRLSGDDERLRQNGTVSTLLYQPQWQTDYGALVCRARNRVGATQQACVFHVVAAGTPDPLINCTLKSEQATSVLMRCEQGFDGGTTQKFRLLVKSIDEEKVVHAEERPDAPVWRVAGLVPAHRYTLSAVALNEKGSSPEVVLLHRSHNASVATNTVKMGSVDKSEATMAEIQPEPDLPSPLIAIISGVCAAILLVLLSAAAFVAHSVCRRRQPLDPDRLPVTGSRNRADRTPPLPTACPITADLCDHCDSAAADHCAHHTKVDDIYQINSAVDDNFIERHIAELPVYKSRASTGLYSIQASSDVDQSRLQCATLPLPCAVHGRPPAELPPPLVTPTDAGSDGLSGGGTSVRPCASRGNSSSLSRARSKQYKVSFVADTDGNRH